MSDLADVDLFTDENGKARILAGVSIISGSTRFAELAGRVGFDVVWIDMEHASYDLAGAEAMCVACEAGGAIPLIRTMGYHRDHVLRALEIGGKLIVSPMVNDADAAADMVRWGKYRPLGERGFYTRSRGLRFGLESDRMARANAGTVLLPQIETLQAVENLDSILSVDGVGGVFIGPGDLSADMGRPGDYDNPELLDLICDCLRRARAAGRHAGVLPPSATMIGPVLAAGADVVIFTTDMTPALNTWPKELADFWGKVNRG